MEETRTSRRSWPVRLKRTFLGLYHRLVRLDDTPRSIAMGTAVGCFIGMTPTYGVQMILTLFINTFLRVNRVAGVVACHITNPITALPAYWLDYKVGATILGQESITREDFGAVLSGVASAPFLEGLRGILSLGGEILGPLVLGSVVLGTVVGATSYPISLVLVKLYKEKRAIRRARRKLKKSEARRKAEETAAVSPEEREGTSSREETSGNGRGGNGAGKRPHGEGVPEADRLEGAE